MLDELLESILQKTEETTEQDAQARLLEIRQLVQLFMADGLLGFVRKVAARLSSPLFDDEFDMLIEAAKDDLKRLNVKPDIVDAAAKPLVKLAITTYCKAHFGLANADSEKYLASYQQIADELRKSKEYMRAESEVELNGAMEG